MLRSKRKVLLSISSAPARGVIMSISKVYIPSDDEFKQIVATSYTYSDCLRKLGLKTSGGSSTDILKRRIVELDISTAHFNRNINNPTTRTKYSIEEILIENSSYSNIRSLKNRLIKEGLLEYRCEKCGNAGEWLGQPLSLQLDHINGKNNDHRIENLRFLCPNCHSQTNTYSGKNKGG